MKAKPQRHTCILAVLASLALASSASLCSAAAPAIVLNTFDAATELDQWGANGSTLTLDTSQDAGGSSTVGCMKVQYPAGSNGWGTQPQRNLGADSFDESQYWSVSFDFKIDPASSYGSDATAPFGHVQIIPIDTGWNWLSGIGWTAITEDYTNWHHVEIGFSQPYAALNALVIQVGDGGFTNDVIFYVDNLKVNPIPATNVLNSFTNSSEVGQFQWANWSQPGSNQWVAAPNNGGPTPAGSLAIYNDFLYNPSNYQQVVFAKNINFDPSRFTYLDMDVLLDPSSYPSADGATFGDLAVIVEAMPGYKWATIGSRSFVSSDSNNWVHLSFPLGGQGLTNADKIIFQLGRGWSDGNGGHGMTNTVIYYVDNIKLWTPQAAPTVSPKIRAGSPGGGLQVLMNQDGQQWERDGLTTPAGNQFSWWNYSGVTYSFTITNFPDAVTHPGFEAHMFMVNAGTCPGLPGTETYGAMDWNAADMITVRLENNASGGVDLSFRYKTNMPNANPNIILTTVHGPTAIGTWSVAFGADNRTVTMTGPGGVSTNFTLDADVAAQLADANDLAGPQMFLNFGAFKNDGNNTGINNNTAVVFSRIQVINGGYPIDETFAGPDLTTTYPWRPTNASSVSMIPGGIAWWITWSLPADGYLPVIANKVQGPYTDAGVTFTFDSGATRVGAIPASKVPAGNMFLRLAKPAQ